MSVVQLACGSIRILKVRPRSSRSGRRRGGDDGLALEGFALVGQVELAVLHPRCVGAELLERVLDLEQVGEIAGSVDPDLEVDGLVLMVEDRQLLVEAIAHRPLADDRQLGVDVDRPGPGHEEEARLEVLEVVDRQRVESLAVDRQHPARDEPHVEREESRRFGRRCLDVTALVTDDERVAVEDPDDLASHRQPLRLPTVRADDFIFRPRRRREESLEADEQRRVPLQEELAAQRGGHGVGPPAREVLEHRRIRPDDAVGRSGVTRHGHGPSTHVHPPVLGRGRRSRGPGAGWRSCGRAAARARLGRAARRIVSSRQPS